MPEIFILIPGRTSRQGTTLNEGKYSGGYVEETSTLLMCPDDMKRLGLSAGDFTDLTARVVGLVPRGRRIAFLEGGYDLDALAHSAAACVAALAGQDLRPERPTTGMGGRAVLDQVCQLHGLPSPA